MNKTEMNLMNKVLESENLTFKVELYKALESNIKEQLTVLNSIMGMNTTEVKPIAPVVEAKSEVKEQPKVKAEPKTDEPKKETKANHKVSNVKKLINCGPSEDRDEVLFIEKRKDSKHLWYGQIRINNYIRNFHWSNELDMPVVYGIEGAATLKYARELIRAEVQKISPKELTLYDDVLDHPDFGGFSGRQYLGALHQGAYIYLTPEATDGDKDTDIIAKGYTNGHAFIVRRDQEVFWRNYNYIFSKKPFESTPSKGFDTATLVNNVGLLYDAVCEQFEKLSSAFYRTTAIKKVDKNTDSSSKSALENAATADISSLF